MANPLTGPLGDYLREQRRVAESSFRQLAEGAGKGGSPLGQLERGLRRPSAEILQQVARALRTSAETLDVRAGALDEREGDERVTIAILGDRGLDERQKRVLLDIYETFRKENAVHAAAGAVAAREDGDAAGQDR